MAKAIEDSQKAKQRSSAKERNGNCGNVTNWKNYERQSFSFPHYWGFV